MKLYFDFSRIKSLRTIFVSCALVCATSTVVAKPTPERVILFILDGLSTEAPERIDMPYYNALMKEGVYYKAMHLPLPGHPEKGADYPWGCSMPNPMLMSGTPFIGMEGIRESMIQHVFAAEETAFIVNAYSYKDISGGFGTYVSKTRNPDSLVIDITIDLMKKEDFRFMRVHLQRAGIEGMKVSQERSADQPYYRNIWHEASLYRDAVEIADGQLGRFVEWLKAEGLWDGTVLLICGDHGQANEGWHEPYSAAANVTPLLIVGNGVSHPRSFEYCEIFDVAPTIAYLADRPPPALSRGRILYEAFDTMVEPSEVPQSVKRLNEVLIEAHALPDDEQEALVAKGFMTIDDLGKWHTSNSGPNFEAFVTQQEAIFKRLQE